jgi:hypothetical protein
LKLLKILGTTFAIFGAKKKSPKIVSKKGRLTQIGGRVFATVANSSIYQQFNATGDLDGNSSYAKGLEEAIESVYHYGRCECCRRDFPAASASFLYVQLRRDFFATPFVSHR